MEVLVSLAQLVRTMHNICKVRGSNPGHHQKKTYGTSYRAGGGSRHNILAWLNYERNYELNYIKNKKITFFDAIHLQRKSSTIHLLKMS